MVVEEGTMKIEDVKSLIEARIGSSVPGLAKYFRVHVQYTTHDKPTHHVEVNGERRGWPERVYHRMGVDSVEAIEERIPAMVTQAVEKAQEFQKVYIARLRDEISALEGRLREAEGELKGG